MEIIFDLANDPSYRNSIRNTGNYSMSDYYDVSRLLAESLTK
jgi:hypothetical protein